MQRTDTQDNTYEKEIAKLSQKINDSWIASAKDYTLRGRAYLLSGQYDKALADAHTAVNKAYTGPNLFRAYALRGAIYYAKNEYQKAIKDLTYCRENCEPYGKTSNDYNLSYNEASDVDFMLGRTYSTTNNIGATIHWFVTSIGLNSTLLTEANSYLKKALTAIRLTTDLSAAKKSELFYAIKIAFPQNEQIPLLLQCLDEKTALGKRMRIKEPFYLRDADRENRILEDIRNYLINIDISFSEPYTTLEEKIASLTAEIDNNWISQSFKFWERGDAYIAAGKYDEALKDAKQALESAAINGTRFRAYTLYGRVYYHQGKYEEAIAAFKTAFNLDIFDLNTVMNPSEISEVIHIFGLAYQQTGEMDLAINLYIKMMAVINLKIILSLYSDIYLYNDILTALQSNTDFSQLPQNGIFNLIKTLPAEHQTSLFLLCLDKETPLGKRMWEKEDPKDWREPSIERGTLKNICDALMVIDPCFSTLINKYAARMPTTSTTTFTKKTPENKKSPENKTDAYFGL